MISDLHRPAGSARSGEDPLLITPESAGWSYCGLRVIHLEPGGARTLATGEDELAVLPLIGGCTVQVNGTTFELEGRSGVFDRVTDFAYVPLGSEVTIRSRSGGEFALPTARARRRLEAHHVPAEEVLVEVRGAGRATRQVNNFMSVDAFAADSLIAVEVLTPGSNISSYPPHKHDEKSALELPLEEIYYYRIAGPAGFGIHRTYAADGEFDETVTVGDGDVFLIPRGYHGPCLAPPEFDMYYLNVMAGPERGWRFTDDPAYAWIRESWEEIAPDPRLPMTSAAGPTAASS